MTSSLDCSTARDTRLLAVVPSSAMSVYQLNSVHPSWSALRAATGGGDGVLFLAAVPEMIWVMGHPSARERRAFDRGQPMRVGFYQEGDVLFVLGKPGDLPWSDAPYHHGLEPRGERQRILDLPTEESRLILLVHLVDSDSGVIRAMRQVSLSPEVSRKLVSILAHQVEHPITQREHQRQIAAAYAHLTTDQMAAATDVLCDVGR